jgi:hypothetical protein
VKRAALAVAATLAIAGPLAAQQDTVPQGRVHVVRRGDTLWDLARQYLADPFLWPEIFRMNTDVVRDPARIYPNERLVLPPGMQAVAVSDAEHTVFYSDNRNDPRSRLTIMDAGTGEFPVVREGDFYRAGYLAGEHEVHPLGYVAELLSPSVVPLERPQQIQIYDRIYLAEHPDVRLKIGDRVQFLRQERSLSSWGSVWVPTGLGTVAASDDGTATAVVIRMFEQVHLGDLVVPVDAFTVPHNVTPGQGAALQGRIVAFQRVHPAQSVEEIAFLDVGRQAGVKEGDVFDVFIDRTRRQWGNRPEIRVARLQVVKVMQSTASARITHLEQPALAVGQQVRRIAAMP